MALVMTVRMPGLSAKRAAEIDRDHPELANQLRELLAKHGLRSHRRVENDSGLLDIDEWPSQKHLMAFVAEADEVIGELTRLRGVVPESQIWTAVPDEAL